MRRVSTLDMASVFLLLKRRSFEHTKNVPSLPDSVEDGNSVVWHLDLLQIDEDGEGLVRWVVEVLAEFADNFNSKSGQHLQGRE